MVVVIENRIPPPIVTVVTGLAMWALSWVTPTIHIPAGIRYGLVGALVVFGVSVDGLAFFSFRRARTTINPVKIDNASSLVTTGIYAFTRNPMYLGLTTLLVTFAVLLSNAWLLLGPVFFVLHTTRFQIIPEEAGDAGQVRFRVRRLQGSRPALGLRARHPTLSSAEGRRRASEPAPGPQSAPLSVRRWCLACHFGPGPRM